jgi:hypothetical protein
MRTLYTRNESYRTHACTILMVVSNPALTTVLITDLFLAYQDGKDASCTPFATATNCVVPALIHGGSTAGKRSTRTDLMQVGVV